MDQTAETILGYVLMFLVAWKLIDIVHLVCLWFERKRGKHWAQ